MKALKLITIAIAIAAVAGSVVAADWQGTETQKDGVLNIMNPANAMESPTEVDLKQRWRLGGESEDEDEFFGVIMQVATDASNNVYLLDSQLHQVNIYTPDGELIHRTRRRGSGRVSPARGHDDSTRR